MLPKLKPSVSLFKGKASAARAPAFVAAQSNERKRRAGIPPHRSHIQHGSHNGRPASRPSMLQPHALSRQHRDSINTNNHQQQRQQKLPQAVYAPPQSLPRSGVQPSASDQNSSEEQEQQEHRNEQATEQHAGAAAPGSLQQQAANYMARAKAKLAHLMCAKGSAMPEQAVSRPPASIDITESPELAHMATSCRSHDGMPVQHHVSKTAIKQQGAEHNMTPWPQQAASSPTASSAGCTDAKPQQRAYQQHMHRGQQHMSPASFSHIMQHDGLDDVAASQEASPALELSDDQLLQQPHHHRQARNILADDVDTAAVQPHMLLEDMHASRQPQQRTSSRPWSLASLQQDDARQRISDLDDDDWMAPARDRHHQHRPPGPSSSPAIITQPADDEAALDRLFGSGSRHQPSRQHSMLRVGSEAHEQEVINSLFGSSARPSRGAAQAHDHPSSLGFLHGVHGDVSSIDELFAGRAAQQADNHDWLSGLQQQDSNSGGLPSHRGASFHVQVRRGWAGWC
jgi:hypothetical protein